jgi:hypothetical protein
MRFCREAAGRLRMSALARIYLNIVNAILKFNKMKSSVYLCCCDIMLRISHLIQHKPCFLFVDSRFHSGILQKSAALIPITAREVGAGQTLVQS